ncbi:hypothetical protein Chor_015264, partial [Crotalus horridus]
MSSSQSLLWAVDIFGRVYTLSTTGQYWELCKDGELELKRVSAIKQCCWGLACDHQVYVYRWNPVVGFCDSLLPSDRWQWSDISGLKHLELDSFALPSPHWEWESDWYVDENFGGEATEKGIPPHQDPKQLPDPFNDISVGGWEITDEPLGRLSVWAVTLQGKIWYRNDVTHHNPEGSSWTLIPAPGEAIQISCGPYDLLWATCWEGQAIVREGIDRNNLQGTSWTLVDPPVADNGILHVSVGVNVVWAVTKDRKVWGISCEDRAIYFRQGVTPSELSGKIAGCFFTEDIKEQSPSIFQSDGDSQAESESLPDDAGLPGPGPDATNSPHPVPELDMDPLASALEEATAGSDGDHQGAPDKPLCNLDSPPPKPQWTNIDLKEASRPSKAAAGLLAETSSLSSFSPVGIENHFVTDDLPLWTWVSSRGCLVDAQSALKWFTLQSALNSCAQSLTLSISPNHAAQWRKQIFRQLSERTHRELDNFRHYEQAVEQWWRSWKPYRWVDVQVALEQFTANDGTRDSILFVYYTHNEEKKYIHMFLNEVTILVEILNEAKHSFALYTPEKTKQRWPIRLAASTEQEMRHWLALLNMSCCEGRQLQGPPSHEAIWSLTCKGDIFVSEPSPDLEALAHPMPCDQMFWRQVGGHLRLIECNSDGIVWGVGLAGSNENIHTQTDVKRVHIYENQRWNPVTGYTNSGPWLEGPPIALRDVSIMSHPPGSKEEFVPLWAISDKGDVLCRLQVTPQNPAGTSWLHVGTDQAFVSVSIGMFHQVWAVAQDGSAFCRGSVSSKKPEGECWYHVPSPLKQKLKQVSVGRTAVLAVDKNGEERIRCSWVDFIWVIADKVQGSHSLSCGTVCHRTGVQPLEPKGVSWDYGIGGGWDHVTIRGNATESIKMAARDDPSSSPPDLSSLEVHGSHQSQTTVFVDGVQGLDKNT